MIHYASSKYPTEKINDWTDTYYENSDMLPQLLQDIADNNHLVVNKVVRTKGKEIGYEFELSGSFINLINAIDCLEEAGSYVKLASINLKETTIITAKGTVVGIAMSN